MTVKEITTIINTIQNDNNDYWNVSKEDAQDIVDFCNKEEFSFVKSIEFLENAYKN